MLILQRQPVFCILISQIFRCTAMEAQATERFPPLGGGLRLRGPRHLAGRMWGVLFLGLRELPASCFRELSRSFGPTPRQVRGSQVGTFLPKVGTSWGVLPATRNRPTHTPTLTHLPHHIKIINSQMGNYEGPGNLEVVA